MDIFRIDRRHDEGGDPAVDGLVIFGDQHIGLVGTLETGGQAETAAQNLDQGRVLGERLHGCTQAGGGAAGERAFHRTDPAADATGGLAVTLLHFLLQHQDPEIEGD